LRRLITFFLVPLAPKALTTMSLSSLGSALASSTLQGLA
jgi:hypothetical protein